MTNAELMNKVMTEDELDIVAGGGPRVRIPLRGPSFKQLKDVTGAIQNAMKDSKYKIKEVYVHEEDGNMDYGASYAVRNDGHSFRGQS